MESALSYFHSVDTKSKSSFIVSQIVNGLFSGRFKSGDFLGSERELCERFQVSRFPVREAIGKLESMGIIYVTTGVKGGIRIAEPNRDLLSELIAIHFKLEHVTVEEIFDARLLIEPHLISLTAKMATAQDVADFKSRVEEAKTALKDTGTDMFTLTTYTRDLRIALVEASRSRALASYARSNISVLFHLSAHYGERESLKKGLTRLGDVISHIEARDHEAAYKTYEQHLLVHRKDLTRRLQDPFGTAQEHVRFELSAEG